MERFANDAESILAEAIGVEDAALTVADPSPFPADGDFRLRIGDELLLVTGVEESTFSVERGIEGTTASAHAKGAEVLHVLTVAALLATIGEVGAGGVTAEELEAEAKARSDADAAEAKVRGDADIAEAKAREEADTAETKAREAAGSAEEKAREEADALKQTLVPLSIAPGITFEIPDNSQVLWSLPIEIEGTLEINGAFVEV